MTFDRNVMNRYKDERLTFDSEAHEYLVDGEKLESVTTVAKRIYNGRKIDAAGLNLAAQRGSIIHGLTEHDDLGDGPPLIQGCQEAGSRAAWQAWRRFRHFTPTEIECRLADPEWGVAGTVDRIGIFEPPAEMKGDFGTRWKWWPWGPGGVRGIVDIKTGQCPNTVGAQMACYRKMASDAGLVAENCPIVSVMIRDDGSWHDEWHLGEGPDLLWMTAWMLHFRNPECYRDPPVGKTGYREG